MYAMHKCIAMLSMNAIAEIVSEILVLKYQFKDFVNFETQM